MTVKEYLTKSANELAAGFVRKPVICKDGTVMSIQASEVHHCYPRRLCSDGDYETLEVALKLDENSLLYKRFVKHSVEVEAFSLGNLSHICHNVDMRFLENVVASFGGIERCY